MDSHFHLASPITDAGKCVTPGSWLSVLPDFSLSGIPRRVGIRAYQTAYRLTLAFSAKSPADSRQLSRHGCIFV